MTAANRGKYAEGKVRDVLKKLEADNLRFTFNRVADAHAAAGRLAPGAGDYQAFYMDDFGSRSNFVIEVKEVEHDFRLPHKNFSEDKVARMRKRQLAGSECIMLVYHTGTKVWRLPEFDMFLHREGGSWNLAHLPIVMPKDLAWEIADALHIK